MIIIHKKRIQIMVTCLLIGIFAFTFQIANRTKEEEKGKSEQPNTMLTAATPVSGKTIVVDAGHGVPDERSTKQ